MKKQDDKIKSSRDVVHMTLMAVSIVQAPHHYVHSAYLHAESR